IIDDLPVENQDEDAAAAEHDTPRVLVIGLPVRDKLDELALELLGVVLKEEPCDLQILAAEALVGEKIAEIEARKPAAVCVLSLPPGDLTATRHAAKRLHARVPNVPVIVGRLGGGGAPARSRQLLRLAGVRDVGFSLEELKDLLRPLVLGAARSDEAEARTTEVRTEAPLVPDADAELSPAH